jgi:hypothetical protein
MDQQTLIIVIAAVIALVAVIALAIWIRNLKAERRRREELQERYGPEYARTVQAAGSEKKAVAELSERERRREGLELHTLTEDDTAVVRNHLARLQYGFVEDPGDALLGLGRVVIEVLRVRGYPVADDREEGLRLLAVDHPEEAQAVRRLLHGEADADATQARETFLEGRKALRVIAGVTYDLADGAPQTPGRAVDLDHDEAPPAPDPAGPEPTTPAVHDERHGEPSGDAGPATDPPTDQPGLYGPDGSPLSSRG